MKTFDIRSPGIADRYPLTILWIEDRLDHVVAEGEVVAVYTTPKNDQRQLMAPFAGRVRQVFVVPGTTLREPRALLEFARAEAEPAMAGDTQDRAAETAGPAAPAQRTPLPAPAMPRAAMLTEAAADDEDETEEEDDLPPAAAASGRRPKRWLLPGAALVLLGLLPVGAALVTDAGGRARAALASLSDLVDGRQRPYEGPLSAKAVEARPVEASLLTEKSGMRPFGVGQGRLEIEDENGSFYCPAVVVGPNAIVFPESCAVTGSPGRPPAALFRIRRPAADHTESLVFPVREIYRWQDRAADAGTIALALVEPAEGRNLADATGTAGFSMIDVTDPPAYVQLDQAAPTMMAEVASRGCRYWTDSEPARDRRNGQYGLSAFLDDCFGVPETGYLRLPVNGGFYFAGFYDSAPVAAGASETGRFARFARYFGSLDLERIRAARDGVVAPGATSVPVRGAGHRPGLYLANTCGGSVTFHFMKPGARTIQTVALKGREEASIPALRYDGEFLYSAGTGRRSGAGVEAITFNGTTYYMRRVRAGPGDTLLRHTDC